MSGISNVSGITQTNFVTVANGGTGASTVSGAQSVLGINREHTINWIGDSMGAISTYQPTPLTAGIPPQWLANTVYPANSQVMNNGLYYRTVAGGTSASSGGPTGVGTSFVDNTVTWRYAPPKTGKNQREFLTWIEAYSLGRLRWNQAQGFQGIAGGAHRIIIVSGGTNYSPSDTISMTNGATGTITVVGGVITAATIINPGYIPGTTVTITTSTGSGATLICGQGAAGTFGIPGVTTAAIVKDQLTAAAASDVDIITVLAGTNDISSSVSYATIIANLKTIYETLVASGKIVVAIPILPRALSAGPTTHLQRKVQLSVNQWIRAYANKETWANPNKVNILLADATRYWMDSTSTINDPIGAAAAGAGAMTVDGLHQSPRGAQYVALSVLKALEPVIGTLPTIPARETGMSDSYDPVSNLSGNILEGNPWVASTAYVEGQHVVNDTAPVKVYYVKSGGSGTSAGSGGPTGTTSTIVDGGVTWAYSGSQGRSVFAQAFDVTPTAAGGITFTGLVPHNMTFSRVSGSASGNINLTQENPYSDGQVGQRCVINFSLGSGTNTENWLLRCNTFSPQSYGIETAALGVTPFIVECELELSGIANAQMPFVGFSDNNANVGTCQINVGQEFADGSGANYTIMNSVGEMLPYPNNGRLYLVSTPMVIPTNAGSMTISLNFTFNASGAAGSATGTIKINNIAVRKAYV